MAAAGTLHVKLDDSVFAEQVAALEEQARRLAEEAVDTVLAGLQSRKGFEEWWLSIDEDIRAEIRDDLIDRMS